jgi:hypothetical protein
MNNGRVHVVVVAPSKRVTCKDIREFCKNVENCDYINFNLMV